MSCSSTIELAVSCLKAFEAIGRVYLDLMATFLPYLLQLFLSTGQFLINCFLDAQSVLQPPTCLGEKCARARSPLNHSQNGSTVSFLRTRPILGYTLTNNATHMLQNQPSLPSDSDFTVPLFASWGQCSKTLDSLVFHNLDFPKIGRILFKTLEQLMLEFYF